MVPHTLLTEKRHYWQQISHVSSNERGLSLLSLDLRFLTREIFETRQTEDLHHRKVEHCTLDELKRKRRDTLKELHQCGCSEVCLLFAQCAVF